MVKNNVKQKFEGVVSDDGSKIAIDIPNDNPAKIITLNTPWGGSVELKAPVAERSNEPGVIASSINLNAYKIDQLVEGKGVYGGNVTLPKKFGIELPTATLWIAPEYLKAKTGKLLTYKNSLPSLAELTDFHGRDGVDLKDRPRGAEDVSYEEALYKHFSALASGEDGVKQGWVMPTKEILHGKEVGSGDVTVENNLYSHRNEMPEGSEFVTASGSDLTHWLWSCTERPDNLYDVDVYNVDFTDGDGGWDRKDHGRLSVRPVCLEFQLQG